MKRKLIDNVKTRIRTIEGENSLEKNIQSVEEIILNAYCEAALNLLKSHFNAELIKSNSQILIFFPGQSQGIIT